MSGCAAPDDRGSVRTDPRSRVLITVAELGEVLGTSADDECAGRSAGGDEGPAPVVLDVRWTLPQPDGRDDFAAGHIPGARYVAMDTELSDHSSDDPRRGRHPLPSVEAFEATVRSWGVRAGAPVVVYDDVAGQAAARAWWMLRWVGHENVRVLDGGWTAWREAGFPVRTGARGTGAVETGGLGTGEAETGRVRTGEASDQVTGASATVSDSEPDAGDEFVARPGSMPVLSADDAAELAASGAGVLLDARAPERFEGLTEPLDPQAGHIPGARNAPAGGNTDDGFFRTADALADYYRDVSARHDVTAGAMYDAAAGDGDGQSGRPVVGAYCGSGVSASHTVLALASIGVGAALFPGSWSAWSNDSTRPVATGTADDETVTSGTAADPARQRPVE